MIQKENIVTEKKANRKTKALLLRQMPLSLHRQIVKHQEDVMIGKNTIEEAAINLIREGLQSIANKQKSEI